MLARVGVDSGAIPPGVFDLTLATALVTIVLSPSLMRAGPFMLAALQGSEQKQHQCDKY